MLLPPSPTANAGDESQTGRRGKIWRVRWQLPGEKGRQATPLWIFRNPQSAFRIQNGLVFIRTIRVIRGKITENKPRINTDGHREYHTPARYSAIRNPHSEFEGSTLPPHSKKCGSRDSLWQAPPEEPLFGIGIGSHLPRWPYPDRLHVPIKEKIIAHTAMHRIGRNIILPSVGGVGDSHLVRFS